MKNNELADAGLSPPGRPGCRPTPWGPTMAGEKGLHDIARAAGLLSARLTPEQQIASVARVWTGTGPRTPRPTTARARAGQLVTSGSRPGIQAPRAGCLVRGNNL